jgi:FkbM family methyltransferase
MHPDQNVGQIAEPNRAGIAQRLKNRLVALGPDHVAVQLALRAAGLRRGWRVRFDEGSIHLLRDNRELVLAKKEFIYVPMMFWYSEFFFDTMTPDRLQPHPVWDYSQSGFHSYKRSGLRFLLPALPEEDAMDAYTHWHTPASGDVVWDVGAHAGVTTFFLSQLVGPTGRVFAWEPDDFNYECLLRNIAEHRLTNVVPIRKALDGKTGSAQFQMDGTMSAGIRDYLYYAGEGARTVETMSVPDAGAEYGAPSYVKMDIEGAELAVVAGAIDFLRTHPVQWAIETNHLIDGVLTHAPIERLFHCAGYRVASSDSFRLWHTWAAPHDSATSARSLESGTGLIEMLVPDVEPK